MRTLTLVFAGSLISGTALAGGTGLSIGGSCPGTLDVEITGAPGNTFMIATGDSLGSTIIPTGPCAGVEMGIESRGAPSVFGPFRDGDGDGVVALSPSVGGPACGQYAVAVDTRTCSVSAPRPLSGGGGGAFMDAFDGWDPSIWDTQPPAFTYSGGSPFVEGDSRVMRTAGMMEVSHIMGSLNKDATCSDHFVVLSDSPDFAWSWGATAGSVKFVWNCNTKYIYSSSASPSVACSDFTDYDIDITIEPDGTATFRDSLCGDLEVTDPALASGPLYLYVGADCDGCTAEWYELGAM